MPCPEDLVKRARVSSAASRRYKTKTQFAIFVLQGMGTRVASTEEDRQFLRTRLVDMRSEHRDLDDVILRLTEKRPVDQLQIQRLKKRKLRLKDEITRIESKLLPDIIA